MRNLISIPIILLFCYSCSSQLHKVNATALKRFEDGKSAYFIDYDATRRGSLVVVDHKESKISIISEPPPDVALTLSNELSAKANVKGIVDAETQYKTVQAIAQLGRRTASVNILRDAMYKLTELKLNHGTIDDKTENLFKEILKVALDFSKVEKEIEENEKAKNQNEASEKKLEILKMQNKPIDIDRAKLYEKNGFEAILNKNMDLAILNFEKCEAAYPTYHNAYEIYRYLNKLRYNGETIDWNAIKKTIHTTYSYGMTSDMKDKFKP